MVSLLFMALGLSAFADTYTKDGLQYTYTAGSGEASVEMPASYKTQESFHIPATITIHGKEYKVTSIADYGFTVYGVYGTPSYTWDGSTYTTYTEGLEHTCKNSNLKSVTFDLPSNIKKIGKFAFAGCTNLEEIVIPSSVEEMGTDVFRDCFELKSVTFQTDEDGRASLKSLPWNCFYLCVNLTSLNLPEGLENIDDYAIQCCLSLKSIHLPNSLKTIGGHFLCNAKSLTELTIPASVTKIDGAFLHGCESLRTVYLLGPAATLGDTYSTEDTSSSFEAFGAVSSAPGSGAVNNCTFYVPSDYFDDYTGNDVWTQLDEKNNTLGNKIKTPLPGEERSFGPNKWQTVIFYNDVPSYKSVFGEDCMVAELTKAETDKDQHVPNVYHLTFTLIDGYTIPGRKPYLIYCPASSHYQMYTQAEEQTEDFKTFYTTDYMTSVEVSDEPGTTVAMIGSGAAQTLQKWDFYFKWDATNNAGTFKRVPSDASNIKTSSFGCYWKILRDGLKVNAEGLAKCALPEGGDAPTAIGGVKGDTPQRIDISVYDLNGRLVAKGTQNLAKGVYVVDGRKVAVK